jgi:hypothetical protein
MAKREHIDLFGRVALPVLLSGDKPTWDSFVCAAVPVVSIVVQRALARGRHDEDAVADVVQKVFVQLCANDYRLLRQFDPAQAGLSTWLAVISWFCANDIAGRPPLWSPRAL